MAARWHVPVVSVGEMLRKEVVAGSAVGLEAARYLDHGQLVPDKIAVATVDAWLGRQQQPGFVFDGFPRTIGQAEALHDLLRRRDSMLDAVLWLDLDNAQIAERVARRLTCADCGATFQRGTHVQGADEACPECGGRLTVRADDDPAALAARMELYRARTEPVAHWYNEQGLLRRVDGRGTPEAVFARIETVIGAGERTDPVPV
jgi:adenylate kinase